jgi:hypothetical protein
MYRLFEKNLSTAMEPVLVAGFTNKQELSKLLEPYTGKITDFFILNHKDEEVDLDLNVIIKPTVSLDSLVNLLQGKYHKQEIRKRR